MMERTGDSGGSPQWLSTPTTRAPSGDNRSHAQALALLPHSSVALHGRMETDPRNSESG